MVATAASPAIAIMQVGVLILGHYRETEAQEVIAPAVVALAILKTLTSFTALAALVVGPELLEALAKAALLSSHILVKVVNV